MFLQIRRKTQNVENKFNGFLRQDIAWQVLVYNLLQIIKFILNITMNMNK